MPGHDGGIWASIAPVQFRTASIILAALLTFPPLDGEGRSPSRARRAGWGEIHSHDPHPDLAPLGRPSPQGGGKRNSFSRRAFAPESCFVSPHRDEGDGAPVGAPFISVAPSTEGAAPSRRSIRRFFVPRGRTSGDQTDCSSQPLAQDFRPARPTAVQPSKAVRLSMRTDGYPRPPGAAVAAATAGADPVPSARRL